MKTNLRRSPNEFRLFKLMKGAGGHYKMVSGASLRYFGALVLTLGISITAAVLLANDDEDEDDQNSGGSRRARAESILPTPQHTVWKTECGACHMLYIPALLPAKSWKKMLAELDKHFGEDASLDHKVKSDIENFLVKNAGDVSINRRGQKITASIPASAVPLRISETMYFMRKHDEINSATYKRKSIGSAANCLACHGGAEKGDFSEREVRIPK